VPKPSHPLPIARNSSKPAARSGAKATAKPSSRQTKTTGGRTGGRSRGLPISAPGGGAISWWNRLSSERKIDILGVILALLGLLSILSLLSKENGTLTRWWVTALRQAGGMGAFILPIGLLLLGLWLILRKVDRFPSPSGERLTGLILLYFNILAWMHLLRGGGWELAGNGGGGGYGGAFFERLLVGAIGEGGTVIFLAAWLIIALVMALDISVTEFFAFGTGAVGT
jgi:S-DNA-T family DNA segregation ATPase FtsK/SpoIIIE